MDIRLTPRSEQLLKEQLAKGGFHSPAELIEIERSFRKFLSEFQHQLGAGTVRI
jgi:hypothetical protein